MALPKQAFRATFPLSDRIDREAGVIKDVAIVSLGAAKGHGVLIDEVTLQQVEACAKGYKGGLKVKFNPNTFEHGAAGVAGRIPPETMRIDEGILRGDIHVLPSFSSKDYLFDLAEQQGDTFGLSIDFAGLPDEVDGVNYARCEEIFAVTVVDIPAANANGMWSFSAVEAPNPTPTPTPTQLSMTEEQMSAFKSMLSEALSPVTDRLTKLEQLSAPKPEDEEPKTDGMSAEEVEEELSAAGVATGEVGTVTGYRKVHAYRRQQAAPITRREFASIVREVGGRPAPANLRDGNGGAGSKTQAFEAKIASIMDGENVKRPVAMLRAQERFPELYKGFAAEREANHLARKN